MSLLSEIRSDSIVARKAALGKPDGTIENVKAKALTTLLSRLQSVMKETQKDDLDDAQVTAIIKKTIKETNDALTSGASGAYGEKLAQEKALLEGYVPQELDAGAILDWIKAFAAREGRNLETKDTGVILKGLNAAYPGQINGKIASEMVKQTIASQGN